MNQYLFQDIKTEDDFSLYQEESFEENYEEMINSYLKERHIYSASLPLPITTDTIIDQIQIEKHQKKIQKDSMQYQLRQQLLTMIKPCLLKVSISSKNLIENAEENSDDMKEIIEVTSSAEQSPTAVNSFNKNIEFFTQENNDIDEFSDISGDISQEIK